jgi:ComEC/Rec2-related protein
MRVGLEKVDDGEPGLELHPRGAPHVADNENLPEIGRPGRVRRLRLRINPSAAVPERRRRQVAAMLREEVGHGRLLLASPVACGAGAIAWFEAETQPSLAYLAILCASTGLLFLYLRFRHAIAAALAAAAALAFLGAMLAAVHAGRSETVILDKPVTTTIAGTILSREASGEGRWRYVVRVTETDDPRLFRAPGKVALLVRGDKPAALGEILIARTRLAPPSGPALPGLTDFAVQAWFTGVGATGFVYGTPHFVAAEESGEGASPWLEDWRAGIGDRIRAVIGGDEGAFAAALVTNEQRAISRETMEALRLSGLAHIIAISGMNMALAAGLSFVGLRLLLALSVGATHSLPVKKIAALGAIAAVTAYYMISGFAVSAERAYIMMMIMLVAVLFDHPAISMRNIALSAWIILLTSPEALVAASFQMSYAGTLGLVAGYEFWARRKAPDPNPGLPVPRLLRVSWTFMAGAVATSLIGGTATALFSLAHFQRLATYGLVANVLVTPLLSFLAMPMLMLAMLLMPLGLDGWPLLAAGWGLTWVIAVGEWVAGWGGEWLSGPLPAWYFASASLTLLMLALLRTRARLLALGFLAMATVVWVASPADQPPDLLLAEDGELAAFVRDRSLSVNRAKPPDFIFGQWQRALKRMEVDAPLLPPEPPDIRRDDRADRYRPLTDEEEVAERLFLDGQMAAAKMGRFVCKRAAWCAANLPGDGMVMVVENSIYTGLACDMASIVVSDPPPAFAACRSGALLISRETLRRTGALALNLTQDPRRPRITASFASLDRPWQAFRAYDWRTARQNPTIPPSIMSLIDGMPAPPAPAAQAGDAAAEAEVSGTGE